MIIIQTMGGLGNQMFQYALYKQLKSMGKSVKIDDKAGFLQDDQRDPALDAFGIVYDRADPEEIIEMRDSSPEFWARVRRRLFGRKNHSYFEEDKLFKPEIFEWDNVYLEGYWQSEKYFPDVGDILRDEFDLERLRENKDAGGGISEQAQRYLWRIEQTKSVSIHIRRGDYLLPRNQALFGNICTDGYYERAMWVMAKKHPGCIFYVFTNDEEWGRYFLRKHKEINNKIILVDLPEERYYEAFALMSRCRHHILANSSFSWWASYLNRNPKKTVIAPNKWLNGWDCRDMYRADMIKIDVGNQV
ncbi:MAG: alpha-1,2-fucosyltransferase [Muribaculaceae bacterium]|nr:alpha-1,2-fucosyltransferase [Muribaculaceae bacterium]